MAETKREVKKPSGYGEAAKKGYLRYLKHMHSRGRLSHTRLLCAAAAASGQLEELKALRAENFRGTGGRARTRRGAATSRS